MAYKFSKGSQVIGDLKAADDAERNTLIDFGEDQIEFQTGGSTRLKVDNQGVEVTGSIHVATGGTIRIGSSSINQNELSRISLSENINSNGDAFLLLDSYGGFTIEDSDNSSASMVFSNPNVSNNASLKIRKSFSEQDSIELHASSGLSLDGGSTFITSAEINVLDSVTAGTAAASKAVVADSNIDITGINTGSFGKIITSKLSSSSGTMELQTGGSTRLKIENDVITTTTALHISASVTAGLRISKNDANYREIQFENDGSEAGFIQINSSEHFVIGNQTNGKSLGFFTTGGDGTAERVRIGSGGYVGIGTASPSRELHVSGSDGRIRVEGNAGNHPGYEWAEAGTRKWIVYNDPSDDKLVFKTDSTDRMVIEQDGKVGIGTTSPSYTLDVSGSTRSAGAVYKNTTVVDSFPYTVTASDYILLVKGSGARTINFPAKAAELGRILIIKDALGNFGSGTVTIDPNGSETIDGQTTKPMAVNWKSMTYVCGPDEWHRVSEFTAN